MPQNRHVVLKSRPGVVGEPTVDNFDVEDCSYPEDLPAGHVLVETSYLSVDPAMRCQMNERTGVHYLQPWKLGEVIQGLGGLGTVISSNYDKLKVGDTVTMVFGCPWSLYFEVEGSKLEKVDRAIVGDHVTLVLSCFGLIGLTSLLGIREKGHVVRGSGQTFVVSGAAGACGSLAGQIAKLEGCERVIGICGSEVKCHFLKDTLGLDIALCYKDDDFVDKLKEVCPNGVQVYFDNVGGDVSAAVIDLMTENSHIVLCGQISQYNKHSHYPPPLAGETCKRLKEMNITRERFLVLNYREKFQATLMQLVTWVKQGKLKVFETFEEGLDKTPVAFINMMKGGNTGKMLVRVADP